MSLPTTRPALDVVCNVVGDVVVVVFVNSYDAEVRTPSRRDGGPLIVLGEGRSNFLQICCGVSGPKICVLDQFCPEK